MATGKTFLLFLLLLLVDGKVVDGKVAMSVRADGEVAADVRHFSTGRHDRKANTEVSDTMSAIHQVSGALIAV